MKMEQDIKNVLVFSPHPDDDAIGCGGSILKHVEQGNLVTVVYMTSGESGSLSYSKRELAAIREQEAVHGADVLGVNEPIFLREPDGYLQNNKGLLIKLVDIIRSKKPHIIYVPHENDNHADHKVTFEAVKDAAGRASGPWFQECQGQPWNVETILAYEVWTPLSRFSYVEDITAHMDKKLEALRQHSSQLEDIGYDHGVEGLNRYRGVMTGEGKYCEVFAVIKANKLL